MVAATCIVHAECIGSYYYLYQKHLVSCILHPVSCILYAGRKQQDIKVDYYYYFYYY